MTEYVNKEYYNSIKGNCAYIDLNSGNIHNVMDRLRAEGIMFSATYGGYRNTVTVSKADSERAYAIAAEYKSRPKPTQQRIIGNTQYSMIKDRNFINTDPETALQVANLLSGDSSIKFSGRLLDNSATITVSGRKNAEMVNRMIDNIRNADIINELFKAGFERLPDTNGFVNIRSNESGEVVGFRNMDMVREMFSDTSNEFFHHSAYRVDIIPDETDPYYISEVDSTTTEERNVYIDSNGNAPTFESRESAVQYADENSIVLDDFEEIISEADITPDVPVEHQEAEQDMTLYEQLINKVEAEYAEFINGIKKETPDVIVESAYEINAKDTICRRIENTFSDVNDNFSDEQISALLSRPYILAELYDEWNNNEYLHSYDDVDLLLEETANKILISMGRNSTQLTELEQNFLETDIEPFMAKSVLAWDEIESLSYILYEDGYTEKYTPNESARFGNGASEQYIYELAKRLHNGEDIRADLTRALLDNQTSFTTSHNNTFSVTYNDDNITANFGNATRSISYEAVGDVFINLIEGEYKDIAAAREEEEKTAAPDFLEFSIPFTENSTLREYLNANPDISFALANEIISYLDEKQHSEREIEALNVGWYDKTDFILKASVNGEEFSYEGRFDIGDGKGTGGGSIIDHIRDFSEEVLASDTYPFNQPEYKEAAQRNIDIFIPFMVKKAVLTAEEKTAFEEFKVSNPVRTAADIDRDDVSEALDLTNNAITFSVITIDGEKTFVVPDYIERNDIHGLEEYQEYISENQVEEAQVDVEYCLLGESGIESRTALFDETDYIAEHLDDIMHHSLFTSLEFESYSIDTPEEMLEKTEDELLEQAKTYIRDYLSEEFMSADDNVFDDLSKISAGYTELGEYNEHGAQMEIDLINCSVRYYFDEELYEEEEYDDLNDMVKYALSDLNFYDFLAISTEALVEYEEKHKDEKAVEAEKTSEEKPETEEKLVPVDIDTAVGMWEYGMTVYHNDIAIEPKSAGLDNFSEFQSDTVIDRYEAFERDAAIYGTADKIASAIWDMNEAFNAVPNEVGQPKYLALDGYYDEWPDYNRNRNEYQNTLDALFEGRYSTVIDYLENVRFSEDVSEEMSELAAEMLSNVTLFRSMSGIPEKVTEEEIEETEEKNIDFLSDSFNADHEGKYMVFEYYQDNNPTTSELAEYLKNVLINEHQGFGLDGYSAGPDSIIVVENYSDSSRDTVEYSWEDVARAVIKAIDEGKYLTNNEPEVDITAEPKYTIYQIKPGDEFWGVRFNSWDKQNLLGNTFDRNSYDEVYSGNVSDITSIRANSYVLDSIFAKFNTDRPADFTGHSLSVSDVIVLEDNGTKSAYFVDDVGMVNVTDLFFEVEREKIDLSKLSNITLTEEYDRRNDEPDDFTHIKNTISFSNLDSSYKIDRLKESTYEADIMPDGDEGMSYTSKQGMVDEVRDFLESMRSDRTKEISITDLNGNTTTLSGFAFDFVASEDRLAFEIPESGYVEIFERDDEGYDYTLYDNDYNVTDSGVYDDTSISIRQALTIILEDENIDIDKCIQVEYEDVHTAAEEKAEQPVPNAENYTPKLGDRFRDTRGAEWELTSLTGALPFYTDDCAISSDNGGYLVTKNISYSELLDTSKYTRIEADPEQQITDNEVITDEKADYVPKIGDVIDMGDEYLTISDISGNMITFTENETLFANTSRMTIDDFLSQEFTVVEETEKEIAEDTPDVPLEHIESDKIDVPETEPITADVPLEHPKTEADTTDVPVEHHDNSQNYVISDDNFGVKTPKARFAANVEAIRTLNIIENEHRTATPEEQAVLAGYTGWGAIPNAFDSDNKEWSNEYAELKELLTDDEYSAARRSTMNAHFTSPVIINAIYEGLSNIGFEQGKILEPAMGIGNFFGAMPENMRGSDLHGVELDSLTGRIAKQLYPDADIQIKGFEQTRFENNTFDAVVGNVPFGDYKLDDKDYNKHKFLIHDYFVAKSIDKVRPGGVLAVVTSKGTMDKENPEMRKYIAQRAELLGAIRLPNNAFKKNAGTEVTSDILFFQKRERPIEIKPDEIEWLSKGTTPDGFSVNNYFVQHPEMVLGTIAEANQIYGPTENTQVLPIEGADLKTQLAQAVKNIQGTYTPQTRKAEKKKEADEIIPAPANSRTFSYYAVDSNVYYRGEDENMSKVKLSGDNLKRMTAMIELRDNVRELLDMQLNNVDGTLDTDISDSRAKLNEKYDAFVEKYGHFDDKKNVKLFKGDDGYNFLTALETKGKEDGEYAKSDIFFHNTVKPNNVVSHVETAQEALILSVAEKARVDFDYMTELCGMDKNTLIDELDGQIFRLPVEEEKYVTADEYLTGNIRFKLRELDFAPEGMDVSKHREALEAAMPKRVEAKDITVKLGSHWVNPEFVSRFIKEKFQPSWRSMVEAKYSRSSGKWKIEGASKNDKQGYTATHDYGTRRRDAYAILEGILNHEDLTVKDPKLDEYGEPIRDSRDNIVKVTNPEETKAVQNMVKKIEREWEDWVFKDPDRREALVDKYNEVFNSIRHREYDGSHLNFVGMNSDISLKEHQRNAVARALYGGNTMLAHCVGAGKTFEMITIAMEGKRLGLHNKSLFAVPNSLTEQMGRDFKKLYPAANILVATKKDFEPKNRKELFAKIATGEWDAVIVGHSQFDRMALSKDRTARYMQDEIESLRQELEDARGKDGSKSFSVKEIEKTIARYEKKLHDDQSKVSKDDYIDFEQMGFDKLFVDECHMYKNLGTATKMSNVAGIGTTGSGKAAELLLKTRYFDELTGGKGLVFASGTPVSNSMTELYTMMRYLQAGLLKDCDINHFDEWAADFGEVKTDYELKPESDGKYQLKTRFAKFTNLPELMGMFKEAADVRTADTLDLEKPTAHVHEVVAQPSKIQKRLIKSLSKRAGKIREGAVDPKDDNMLCVTNDGRKIGLDQRLMQPGCPDDPNSKVNMCVNNVFEIHQKNADKKSTQMIFCDMSTPKSDSRQDRFEIYRPDYRKNDALSLVRKKVGLGSGDEDSPKRISTFADIKAYVDKHSPDADDKLQNGDIAVFRVPSEDGTTIESRAAMFMNGQFIDENSPDLFERLEMSPIEDMPPKPFNVYDDIRDKLIAKGVDKDEIAFIHDYDTAEKKQELFNQMNRGEVRILLGSTQKCGAGMNAQAKMIALHHLDAPLRPSDMEQRNGRIERQGNENPEVDIFRYVTDKSFDAYLYQILENKQKFISQVMTSKTPERTCSDVDEQALDYAEVKALCAGNPLIKKEMELQALIKDLKTEKSRFNENLYELQDNIRVKYPNEIKQNALIIKHYTDDIKTATSAPKFTDEEGKESYGMKLGEKVYTTRKDAGEALRDILNKNLGTIMSGKELNIGEYRGLKLSILYNDFRKLPQACLRGEKAHYCDLNISTDIGNITRLDNCIGNIQKTIDDLTAKNEARIQDLERMKSDVEKPFEREQELADAVAELEDVHVKLTEFELTDDSAQKDMFERLADNFTEVLTGQKSYVCYDVHDDNAMPLFVEMQGNILTVGKSFVQNGDLMYSPRVDFTVDYENKKVTPISYEISSAGVYEQFDINDGKPETMKAINEVLTKFDDMMDEIEANGFTAHSESVSEKSRDVVSR